MEEVDGLGGGREVGKLEFPKTNLGSRIVGRKKKKKWGMGEKIVREKKNKKHKKKRFQNKKNYSPSKLIPGG